MGLIKNILFVSYLKNKGVRRVCFALGILFSLILLIIIYMNYDNLRIKEEFTSLEAIRYNIASLKKSGKNIKASTLYECTNKLYAQVGVQADLLNLYRYDKSMSTYDYCANRSNDAECLFVAQFDRRGVNIDCDEHNFLVLSIIIIISFYLAFWMVCILKFFKNIYLRFRDFL